MTPPLLMIGPRASESSDSMFESVLHLKWKRLPGSKQSRSRGWLEIWQSPGRPYSFIQVWNIRTAVFRIFAPSSLFGLFQETSIVLEDWCFECLNVPLFNEIELPRRKENQPSVRIDIPSIAT